MSHKYLTETGEHSELEDEEASGRYCLRRDGIVVKRGKSRGKRIPRVILRHGLTTVRPAQDDFECTLTINGTPH